MASVEIYLLYNGAEEGLCLPVNPSEISVQAGSANETVSVQRLGEVTIIQDPVLKTISFSSQFPKHYGPYCVYKGIPEPYEAVAMVEKWRNSGHPVQFLVINSDGLDLDLMATIESITYKETAGDVGTIYYDISLKEYRYIKPRTVETKEVNGEKRAKVSKKGKRPNHKIKPKSYTVKAGDSIWTISRRVGVAYEQIAEANGIKAPYRIVPNQVLMIP